ncbi:flagellar biosynthetic protein FliO [Oceanobacillus saliphilus]|uniref:flagellar biosynthetic protein FliO n=1 Tax=Oceanobacillus saliphilus TaxID=2925834 RepID=UPI00201DEF9F|nr:flagellar biosynthetic protein FliO [Oceanobacillus saliphilus]
MKKNILYIFCISLFAIAVLFVSEVAAVPAVPAPNVTDCLAGEADCEDDAVVDAQETNNALLTESESPGSLIFELIKMFFALLLILALIYLLIKFLNKRNKLFNQVKALENLGGISVGQNKSIQIVRIGTQLYLVGVGDNVQMLQEITDEEIKKDIMASKERSPDDFPGGALLTSLTKKQQAGKNDSTDSNFKALFSKELENLKQNRKKMINKHKEDTHE